MTLAEWLTTRRPAPPAELAGHVRDVLAPWLTRDAGDATAICLDAATAVLRDLLAGGSAMRDQAIELLAVDALVTYAFEAASTRPDALDAQAREAMARIASLTPGAPA